MLLAAAISTVLRLNSRDNSPHAIVIQIRPPVIFWIVPGKCRWTPILAGERNAGSATGLPASRASVAAIAEETE